MKKKVVFLGSRPLGAYTLRLLSELPNVEIVACICRKPSSSAWWDDDPCHIEIAPIVSLEDLYEIDYDLGVSINFWKLLPHNIITKPSLGFVNQHHAHNLSLRGRNMSARAILQSRSTGRHYHGSCLHYIDDGLDTGPIIESLSCDISYDDTGWTLFQKCEEIARTMLSSWLPRLLMARAPVALTTHEHPVQLRASELERLKFIADVHHDPEIAFDIVRAFDFEGFYDGAYTVINGTKLYLTTTKSRGDRAILSLDESRSIYSLESDE